MKRNLLLGGIGLTVLLNLTACDGSDDDDQLPNGGSDQSGDGSMFNPDLPGAENTGEPGGDISAIAGLWDGTTTVNDTSDVIYWNLAVNGVITRYDYQQDGAVTASGENCYIVGEPITVNPEGGTDYSFFNVAVTAERNGNTLTITFNEADRNDLDVDDDITEMPIFTWTLLDTPVLEDLNSCTPGNENSDEGVTDGSVVADESETEEGAVAIPVSEVTDNDSPFPVGINWADIPQYSGEGKPYITRLECTGNGGSIVGDIGDGSIFQTDYRCESGAAPIAYITYLDGEPISVEGEVCCV